MNVVAKQEQAKQLLEADRKRKEAFGNRVKAAAIDAKPTFDSVRKEYRLPPVRVGNIDDFLQVYNLKRVGPSPSRDTAKRWFAGQRIPSPKYRIDLCVLLGVTWDFLISGAIDGSASAQELEARQDQKTHSRRLASFQLSPRVDDLPAALSKFVSSVVGSINEMAIEYLEQKRPE